MEPDEIVRRRMVHAPQVLLVGVVVVVDATQLDGPKAAVLHQ